MKERRMGASGWMLAGLASLMLVTGAATAGWSDETADDPGDGDRAIGVVGALVCGAEGALLRVNPLLGMNPWVLTAGILGCGLMLLDMAT
jgi:hypothetical protein